MKKLGVFVLLISVIFFSSCEIGLGASVDTESPSLEITNPPSDAVIRDSFAIQGTWNDDGAISAVTLEMVRLDNKKKFRLEGTYTNPETEKDKGTWKIPINPKEKGLLDGTYEAIVAIRDKGGHKTTMARTFTIDNTPPLLVLSRPSIKDGQNGFDSYGRSFTLEGKAADDNDVSLIEVKIYENQDSETPMKVVELKNVPLTIEQDVAIYESEKANDYAVIYGHTDENGIIQDIGATEQRYCTVTIYDGAKRYPANGKTQSEEDKKGNSTDVYYLNSEITALLQGQYKITELYHIRNGTYGSDSGRSAVAEQVKALLDGYKVTRGKFSINPANNPRFILSSGNVLENGKNLDNVDYQFTAGNRYIEVEIRPGLDGYPIKPDTVGVYLLECDENGVIKSNADKIWLINPGAEYHKTQEEVEAQGLDLASGYGIYTVSGSTYKFKTSRMLHKANYAVNTGHYYVVKVDGYDSQGANSGSIISDGTFAFKLISNEGKIELSAHGVPDYLSTKAAAWEVAGHESFTVTLDWSAGEGPFNIYRQSGSGDVFVDTVTNQTNGVWEARESFTYSQLKDLAPEGKEFPEKLSYYLKNQSGDVISTTARINLKYDSDEPSITNVQFSKTYLDETTNTYFVRNVENNTSNINGIATDDTGIEKVELVVDGSTITSSNDGRFKFENVDFHDFSGSGLTANIVATDVAGNQHKYPLKIVFDTEAPRGIHEIDASSKDLYFRIGNADNDDVTPTEDKDKKVGGKYGNGTFGNATTIQIRGKFEDNANGSGVKMIYYKVYETEQLLSDNPETAEEQIKDIISEVKENPTGQFAPIETLTKRIFYNVGKKKNAQGQYVNPPEVDETQIFEGSTAFTTSPNDKGYYKYYKDIESNFNNTLSGFKEGNNYLVLAVEDNVGNITLDYATVNFNGVDKKFINYTLNVDTTPPSDITTESHSGIIYTNSNTEPLVLWGTVSDKASTANGSAGMKSFVLSRDGISTSVSATLREVRTSADEEGNPADSEELQALAAADSTLRIWEADVSSLLPATSTTVSITATARDAAGEGNTAPAVVATVNVDLDAPEVLVSDESPADADTSDNIIQVNGNISFTGTSDDENGIDELLGLYYKTYTDTAPSAPAAKTPVPPEGWTAVSATKAGTTSWKFTNINTAKLDGTNPVEDKTKLCFTVAVKDKAGNIGYSEAKALVVDQDTDRPVIHLTSLPLTYKDESQQLQKMNSANPVWFNRSELSGTIDDDDGAVEYVKVIAQDATETSAPSDDEWTAATNVYKNGIWAYTIPSNGNKKIYFQIKEKGENGKIYTSNTASTTSNTYGPKIQDVNSVKFGYKEEGNTPDDILYVKVDTDDPILDNMYYYTSALPVDNPESTIPDYNASTQTPGWKLAENSIIPDKFGGSNKYLYIKCKTHDTNGISAVSFKFADIDPLAGKTVEIPQALGQENFKEIITCFNIKADTNPVPSGLTKLEINIKDNAAANTGSSGISKYYDVIVDNTNPEISFSNYTKGTQVYGSSAVTLRGSTSDSSKVEKVEYALSKNGNEVPADGWIEITDEAQPTYTSKLGWQIVFDDKITGPDSSSYHAELLKKALFSLYNVAEAQQASYDTTKKIYIWMRATDELGNCGTNIIENGEGFYLYVIPNGDKPAIDITYPSDGASVGGTIRITGTTDIQDTSASVKHVYLQIDPSYDATDGFNENGWASELQGLMDAKGVTSYEIKDLTGVTVEGTSTNLGTEIGKGIPSLGNSKLNWYLIINGNKELNEKVGGNNRKIAIRVFAVSSTGKVSKSEVYVCEIDPEAPTFGQTDALRFVQYTDNSFSTEASSRTFENGVYLTGQWYLVGSVEDDSGIRLITLDDHNIVWTTGTGEAETVHDDGSGRAIKLDSSPNATSKFKNYKLRIPVGNTSPDSFGKIDYEISVTDGSDSQTGNSLKFTIYYDNKAPEFEAKKGNGKDLEDGGKIYQSNGAYTVQGSFKEASVGANNQSGFKRIAMFYTRERTVSGAKGLYLIDSMISSGDDGTDNFIKLASIGNGGALTYEANVSKANGLYWRKVNGTLENSNELTLTDNTYITNKTIRAGGLCMIDNVIYRINRITGTKLILDGTIPDFTTAKPVYFAYAQIIDNLSQESGNTSLYSSNDTTTNKDDDCMIEGVQFSGGEYIWNASIDSSNMLDGNVTMSFVGYDAAGNYTQQSWNQKISNNAPRIAGVSFGTDIDLDGTISPSEMTETYAAAFTGVTNVKDGNDYNGQDADGNWITEYTVPETITVKGAVKVKPMIVGGNTALGWQYTYKTKTGTTQSTSVTQYAGVGHSYDGSVRASDLSINISLKDFLAINIGEGNQNLKFTIWDETDGSTLGDENTGSAKADIFLPVNIIIADSDAPEAVVSPFYWKSAGENSIYQGNSANGHIELESDWATSGNLNAGNAGLDGDAKVSGKITFDGLATDNVIVEKIKAIIPGYNNGNEFVIAQRDASVTEADGWISNVTLNPGTENQELVNHLYYKKGDEVKANASLSGASALDWVFELISDEYDEDGKNIINFKFHFNTEKISTKAATDVSIKFTAMDKGSPTLVTDNSDPDGDGSKKRVSYSGEKASTPGNASTASGALTGCYKVDVVPYITKISTTLGKLKANNPSVYGRTAKGNYPVSASEVLNFEGFNISGGQIKFVKDGGFVNASYNANAGGEGIGGYLIPETAKSGNISIIVSSVESLNNLNNNEAKGTYNKTVNLTTNPTGDKTIYDNYYNRQPNGDNNNLLTDDVILDIWDIDPMAVKPKSGTISQPVMDINPVGNHNLGFAFVNGTAFFSMAYGINSKSVTPNSYEYWIGGLDAWSAIGFTYDVNGYSFGLTAGGDINTSKNGVDEFRFTTSRWDGKGQLKTDGYTNLDNQWGLEYIGQREFYSYEDSEDLDDEGNPKIKWTGFTNFDKDRIRSPSISTTASTSNTASTKVYIAYYDSINDEIRFRCGTITNTRPTKGKLLMGSNLKTGDNRKSEAYSLDDTSLIAGQTKDKYTLPKDKYNHDGNATTTVSAIPYTVSKEVISDGKRLYAGEYVSLVALADKGTNDDAVVVVWWDAENRTLLYSYNKTPNSIASGSYEPSDTHWEKPVTIFPANVGEYCKVTADAEDGIHIAAYDSLNGDLWYAYIKDFDTPSGVKAGIVDSYGFVGSELNIKVAMEAEHKPIPYISYYALSCSRPKIAYWNKSESLQTLDASNIAGVNLDAFNANWESTIIPTSSKVPSDHINVGVWKNAAGVRTWSTTDGNAPDETGSNIGVKDLSHIGTSAPTVNSYGTVYGNGTKNPLLGYAIKQGALGFIETAQMK